MSAHADWIIAALTFLGVLLIPTLVMMVRGAVKWTKVEDKLGELVEDIRTLVLDENRTHSEMLTQMRIDRDATDRRLRFIEEFFMERGRKNWGSDGS